MAVLYFANGYSVAGSVEALTQWFNLRLSVLAELLNSRHSLNTKARSFHPFITDITDHLTFVLPKSGFCLNLGLAYCAAKLGAASPMSEKSSRVMPSGLRVLVLARGFRGFGAGV